jgi:hypothetical protein
MSRTFLTSFSVTVNVSFRLRVSFSQITNTNRSIIWKSPDNLPVARQQILYQPIGPAGSVFVTGSFNNWEEKSPLVGNEKGEWSTIIPLPPGVHEFKFIVDGPS